jgi:hypothetical protein
MMPKLLSRFENEFPLLYHPCANVELPPALLFGTMALRKVTFFDPSGVTLEPVEADGQVIKEIGPTRDLSPFEPGKGPIEIEALAKAPANVDQ